MSANDLQARCGTKPPYDTMRGSRCVPVVDNGKLELAVRLDYYLRTSAFWLTYGSKMWIVGSKIVEQIRQVR
jgi:hypothetical protein